ncbi:MAG: Bug family tripartite tricarboxylate transporter substrate binding protein [Burkholderiales bacterium]
MKLNACSWRLGAAVALAGAVFSASPVLAQGKNDISNYPARPVRFITPAAPGGTTDILARLFSDRLTRNLKQQFIVDNRASASGVLAAELTTNAAPDGYTLFLAYHQHVINAALLPKLPYHPINDFTPITQLTAAALLLVVHPATPAKDFKEFLTWAKSYKGSLNFGSAGIGSGGHLSGELFKLMTGVQAVHIPYKGTGPALAALLGQEYHFNFMGLAAGARMAATGKLRALGITSAKRAPGLPDIPTIAEQGLPGFEVEGWYGVMGPKNMPPALVQRLHGELIKIMHTPEMQKTLINMGSTPIGSTPQQFKSYLVGDLEKWSKVVKASGAKAN